MYLGILGGGSELPGWESSGRLNLTCLGVAVAFSGFVACDVCDDECDDVCNGCESGCNECELGCAVWKHCLSKNGWVQS